MSGPKDSLDEQSCVASSRINDGLKACHKIIENYRLMLNDEHGDTESKSDPDWDGERAADPADPIA